MKPVWSLTKWACLPPLDPSEINPRDKNYVCVAGDPTVGPTRNWFGALLGKLWRWKRVAVLEPFHEEIETFYIGFIANDGNSMICLRPVTKTGPGLRIGMRIGHEDVVFFGMRVFSQLVPIPLKIVEITTKDDPKYKDLPLF